MRSFQKIFAGLDVIPLLNALAAKPHLWNANTLRTTFPGSPHAACDDIWLFFNDVPDDHDEVVNDIAVRPYPAWTELPQARHLVFDLMRRVEGVQLGRVLITRLAPGKTIPEHADQGAPAEYYQRYQIALQSMPGCLFNCGEEVVQFSMGECWWIDNRQPHSVVNNSADDRLALIVDVRLA
jgi:hypothetical protein